MFRIISGSHESGKGRCPYDPKQDNMATIIGVFYQLHNVYSFTGILRVRCSAAPNTVFRKTQGGATKRSIKMTLCSSQNYTDIIPTYRALVGMVASVTGIVRPQGGSAGSRDGEAGQPHVSRSGKSLGTNRL